MAPSRAALPLDALSKCIKKGARGQKIWSVPLASARSPALALRWQRPSEATLSRRGAHTFLRPEPEKETDDRPTNEVRVQRDALKAHKAPADIVSSSRTATPPRTTIPRPPRTRPPYDPNPDLPTGPGTRQPLVHWPKPYYQMTFTCLPCGHRSSHSVSKQGYHKGSVLISCPQCRNRHVISDHLRIFGDRDITVEDLMREKGRLVKRGSLGEDGDIEFWQDDAPVEKTAEKAAGTNLKGAERLADTTASAFEDGAKLDRDAPPGASFKRSGSAATEAEREGQR
jgi:protein import protein ZIM17